MAERVSYELCVLVALRNALHALSLLRLRLETKATFAAGCACMGS